MVSRVLGGVYFGVLLVILVYGLWFNLFVAVEAPAPACWPAGCLSPSAPYLPYGGAPHQPEGIDPQFR